MTVRNFNFLLKGRLRSQLTKDVLRKYLPVVSTVLYLLIVFVSVFVYAQTKPPTDFPKDPILVNIPNGASVQEAVNILGDAGVIKNKSLLILWLNTRYENIKAGDYLFKTEESMWSVASRVALGVHGLVPVRITVKEGATRKEMADLFAAKLMRFNKDKFLLMSQNMEGFLFPDTYHFLPNADEKKVIDTMYDNFLTKIEPLREDIERNELTLRELITLASLVEREAYKYEDRRKIAGVLLNRLEIGMPLQVDVTWFYTDNKGTPGITMYDLRDKTNPYNTYIYKGLPPSPIGSPGLSAIKATLYPEKTNYFFYLADNKGNTYFSKTYKEHLYKRRKYIR